MLRRRAWCGGAGGELLFDELEVALQDIRRVALLCNCDVARVDGGEEFGECLRDSVFIAADSGLVLKTMRIRSLPEADRLEEP